MLQEGSMEYQKRDIIKRDIADDQCVECVIRELIVDIDDRCLRLRGGKYVYTPKPWFERAWEAYDENVRHKTRAYSVVDSPLSDFYGGKGKIKTIKEKTPRKGVKVGERVGAALVSAMAIAKRYQSRKAREMKRDKAKAEKDYLKFLNEHVNAKYLKEQGFPVEYNEPSATPKPSAGGGNNLSNTMIFKDSAGNVTGRSPNSGAEMLSKKMSTMRMYKSYCKYHMSVIKDVGKVTDTNTTFCHQLTEGCGPALYSVYDYGTENGSTNQRNFWFNTPKIPDPNFISTGGDTFFGIGKQCTTYVFAADWPWLIMNHDTVTQATDDYRCLRWRYDDVDNTLDVNKPLKVSDFILNVDWKYIKVYGCDYIFDFTNIDFRDYVVEILLFKFKADADTMNYNMQVHAPYSRQPYGYKEYINRAGFEWNSPDIKVVKRTRLLIPGMRNTGYAKNATVKTVDGTDTTINGWGMYGTGENCVRHTLKVRRQYMLTRPILTTVENLTEVQFFNSYYEPDKGVYIRMSAWPNSGALFLNTEDATPYRVAMNKQIDDLCMPTEETKCETLGGAVDVKIFKRGRFKFDEPRIKGLN